MSEDTKAKTAQSRLIATVFHHCGLTLHQKGEADVISAMSAAKKEGITLEMLREYGGAHNFTQELLSVMEQAFAA